MSELLNRRLSLLILASFLSLFRSSIHRQLIKYPPIRLVFIGKEASTLQQKGKPEQGPLSAKAEAAFV